MDERTARAVLDGAYVVGPVPRRLFGSFVEHMGPLPAASWQLVRVR
ncbi:MAG TPA: hypothetical protein VD859_15520 [Nocardioides sp.]|nr:hypothetical protein [Nocardioides sp.]